MDGLVDDGLIVIGGPVGSGARTLHLFEAAGEAEVRRRMREDPWAAAGLLEVRLVEPWALWLDGRQQDPRPGR
jgi:hypothetical protein